MPGREREAQHYLIVMRGLSCQSGRGEGGSDDDDGAGDDDDDDA